MVRYVCSIYTGPEKIDACKWLTIVSIWTLIDMSTIYSMISLSLLEYLQIDPR
jgi:hypothetical protein